MSITLDEIQIATSQLPLNERAHLAHILLRDLDQGENEDVESIWLDEARKRLHAYKRGEMTSSPTEDVISRVSNRLRG
ncbi:MAG: addiction module protein [Acidobacteria bacterium]|nr:addiction module protein [Acidobacteriota bacterium]